MAEFPLTEQPNLQLALDAVLGDADVVGFTTCHAASGSVGLTEILAGAGMAGAISLGPVQDADAEVGDGRVIKWVENGVFLAEFDGPPGTGKTLSVMYLLHAMPGRTTILLIGRGLGLIEQALAIGRELAPATFVFEDIDLVATERTMHYGSEGVLFELLNQMEGLAEDEDMLFLLTTNRPDVIEPALAARPGRIDLALEIPLPDAEGRRRLFALYGEGINIDAATEHDLVERSDGISSAFIKVLMRQAWLRGALERHDAPSAEDLRGVLDELLEERSTLTRRLLGQHGDHGGVQGGGPFPAMLHALSVAGMPVPSSPDRVETARAAVRGSFDT